jgi:hypothetical protein
LASSFSRQRNFSLAGIPDIGRWLALISLAAAVTGIPLFILLDPLAIFNGFFAIFNRPVSLPVVVSFAGLPALILLHLYLPGLLKQACSIPYASGVEIALKLAITRL